MSSDSARITAYSETEPQLARTRVGVEKVGTNQLIFMRSVWQCEMFSSIV